MVSRYGDRGSYSRYLIRMNIQHMAVFYLGIMLLSFKGAYMRPSVMLWNYIKGFSYYEFNVVEFIYFVFPAAITIFVINSTWEKDAKNRNVQAMLRVGSRKRWKEMLERRSMTYVFVSLSIHIGIAMSLFVIAKCALLTKGNDQHLVDIAFFYGISEEKVYISVIICLCIRFIEWMLLYAINKTIYSISHSCITAYILTMAAYIPGFLFGAYYPLGKGSLYQVLEILDSIGESGIVLVIGINLVLVIFLYVVPVLVFRLKRRCAYECSN